MIIPVYWYDRFASADKYEPVSYACVSHLRTCFLRVRVSFAKIYTGIGKLRFLYTPYGNLEEGRNLTAHAPFTFSQLVLRRKQENYDRSNQIIRVLMLPQSPTVQHQVVCSPPTQFLLRPDFSPDYLPMKLSAQNVCLRQRRTGDGSVMSPNSALPSRNRRICGDCEMWTAVGWGEQRELGVQVAANQEIYKSFFTIHHNNLFSKVSFSFFAL